MLKIMFEGGRSNRKYKNESLAFIVHISPYLLEIFFSISLVLFNSFHLSLSLFISSRAE